ncbi:MAG: hypothetical protein ACFFCX_15560 [Candidatus Sifarchaeia archaeon]
MKSLVQTASMFSEFEKTKTLDDDSEMIKVFVKLLSKGLRSSDYVKFPFQIQEGASLRDLIGELIKEYSARFDVYLEDTRNRVFCNDTIILVNGKMIVAGWKLKMGFVSQKVLDSQLYDGDMVVFMIVTRGG